MKRFHLLILLLIIPFTINVFATRSPLQPGKYVGFNTDTAAFGETVFDIKDDGEAIVSGADGRGIMSANFDFGALVRSEPLRLTDPMAQTHLNAVYSTFRQRQSPKPLVLIKNYLSLDSTFDDSRYSLRYNDMPAILIFPSGVFGEGYSVSLYTPNQVASGVLEIAVGKFEEKMGTDGLMPRLKTGGKNFRACLDALQRAERPN